LTPDLKPGDKIVVTRPFTVYRGALNVRGIDLERGVVETERRAGGRIVRRCFDLSEVVKLEPGQSVKHALMASVPANQRCDICGFRPATERHFVTVPLPEGFMRVCMEDMADIKKKIRKRVKKIVNKIFREAKKQAEKAS